MKTVLQALKNIEPSGTFWSQTSSSSDALKLNVEGIKNPLKFPLETRHMKSLIKIATPAKFGWRNKTLLDKTVRDVWELKPEKFSVKTSDWDKQLHKVIEDMKYDLGLSLNDELEPQLHNLLIYEKGQFFHPHQDTEKINGMVATLVIVLPSHHRGGELIVDHHGEKVTFSSSYSNDKLAYFAFYADCHHEVKPVSSGYRVVLTYNLILKKSNSKKAAEKDGKNKFLIESLRTYFSTPIVKEYSHQKKEPKRLVYLLDHEYTEAGLSWDTLKNTDRKRADALLNAADILNLKIYLVLAEVKETWDCIMEDYYYDRYDDDMDEEADNTENVETTDLIDSETCLIHWLDRNNKNDDGEYLQLMR